MVSLGQNGEVSRSTAWPGCTLSGADASVCALLVLICSGREATPVTASAANCSPDTGPVARPPAWYRAGVAAVGAVSGQVLEPAHPVI